MCFQLESLYRQVDLLKLLALKNLFSTLKRKNSVGVFVIGYLKMQKKTCTCNWFLKVLNCQKKRKFLGVSASLEAPARLLVSAVQEYCLLYEESVFFQLAPLQKELEHWKAEQESRSKCQQCHCALVHIAPGLGEKVGVSACRSVIEEVFPEVTDPLSDGWTPDSTHLSHFPLSSRCRLSSVQV